MKKKGRGAGILEAVEDEALTEFRYLLEEYVEEPDGKLTKDAIALKNQTVQLLESHGWKFVGKKK